MKLNESQAAKHRRLQTDFRFFAQAAPLMVLPKEGGQLLPLRLNRAQEHAHAMAERQLGATGKVRALVVKGRQQGMSTYIEGRFYQKTTRVPYTNAFILTHLDDATDNIFKMVKRYHENVADPMRPATAAASAKELIFKELDSSYAVGTAGSKNTGRSRTIRLFHGSEVAYWRNTADIRKGAMQAVADLPGTEIWLESTANGMGGMFHEMVMEALAGKSEYIVIFVPWFWTVEYQRQAPADFQLDEAEVEYRELYSLSIEQMVWRRGKIAELGGVHEFKREYPAHVLEAFEASGDGLIRPEDIVRARQSKITDKLAPLVMGVDPGRTKDRTVIVFRRGREAPAFYKWDPKDGQKMDQMRLAGIVGKLIDKHEPAAVFIDVGEGHGTIDRLHELGYGEVVHGVGFGEGAALEQVYANKRAEMWGELAEWLSGDAKIPDDDELHRDLSVIPPFRTTSNSRKILPSKESIKNGTSDRPGCGFSPDLGDALALTFAHPVNPKINERLRAITRKQSGSGLKTLSRFRKAG